MTSETDKAQFKALHAMMWVTDVPRAVEYYSKKLGCELVYQEDDCSDFAIVARDQIQFHIQICACDDGRHTGNTFIEVEVNDAVALHDELQSAGAIIERELKHQDWGSSDFKVADPDGNWILFTSDTPDLG